MAALYARYSSDAQNDGNSIEAQINAITDYAQREDVVIVEQYKDMAKSGTTADRPEFQRMMKDAEQKRFQLVLVHKYDRSCVTSMKASCMRGFLAVMVSA